MITLYYKRSGINDMRVFKNRIELIDWIICQCKFEKITIIKIEEGS